MLGLRECAGIRVRAARIDDREAIVDVRARAWTHAYRDLLPRDELARMVAASRRIVSASLGAKGPERGLLVAQRGSRVVGYAMLGRQVDPDVPFAGEVHELYLDPDHHGLGIGSVLLSGALWTLVDRRLFPVIVWVLASNRARTFYEACGGIEVARGLVEVGGFRTLRVGYAWSDRLPLPPTYE